MISDILLPKMSSRNFITTIKTHVGDVENLDRVQVLAAEGCGGPFLERSFCRTDCVNSLKDCGKRRIGKSRVILTSDNQKTYTPQKSLPVLRHPMMAEQGRGVILTWPFRSYVYCCARV